MLDSLSMLARCMSSSGLTLIWSLLFLLVIQLIAAMFATWLPSAWRIAGESTPRGTMRDVTFPHRVIDDLDANLHHRWLLAYLT